MDTHEGLNKEWLEAFARDDEEKTVAPISLVSAQPRKRDASTIWRGVEWLPVVNGLCSKHGTAVGELTRLCIDCHREQLEAARAGSNAWETPRK